MSTLFRKTALDRLSSPEQIDQLLPITPLRAWIALVTVAAVIFLALLWGILGSIATYVNASGIFVREGGSYEIVAYGEGRLLEVTVKRGEQVRKGQVVAKVDLPELHVRLENARYTLEELQREDNISAASEAANMELSLAALDEQKTTLENSIKDFDQQVVSLQEQVQVQEDLQTRGLIPKTTLLNTRTGLASAKQNASNANVELATNASRRAELAHTMRENAAQRRMQLTSAQHQLEEIQKLSDETSNVTSPYDGRILDLVMDAGGFLHRNSPVMTLEVFDRPLEVVLFIPSRDGKRVKPGMEAQVSPSSAQREEFGFIVSKVLNISDFPLTDEAAQKRLHSTKLVQQLTGQGSVLMSEVSLERDPATRSGFRWSSSEGPDTDITSGTICEARVVVRRQKPITLVLPYLRKLLGID